MDKVLIVLLVVLGVSLLPIWRVAGSKEGFNAWQAVRMVAFESAHKHITAEDAIEQAGSAHRITSAGS